MLQPGLMKFNGSGKEGIGQIFDIRIITGSRFFLWTGLMCCCCCYKHVVLPGGYGGRIDSFKEAVCLYNFLCCPLWWGALAVRIWIGTKGSTIMEFLRWSSFMFT